MSTILLSLNNLYGKRPIKVKNPFVSCNSLLKKKNSEVKVWPFSMLLEKPGIISVIFSTAIIKANES